VLQVFTCGFITLATVFLLSHFFGQCVQLPNTWMADKYGFAFTCPKGAVQPSLCSNILFDHPKISPLS